jgi:hypothetical protein
VPPFELRFIVLGALGGLLPDIIRLAKNYDEISVVITKVAFYVSLGLLAVLGGFAAWLFHAATDKEAVGIGIAAPALLSQLGASTPRVNRFTAAGQRNLWERLRGWWAK